MDRVMDDLPGALRPAVVCQHLLAAMDASEGRRKRRKRNTTPDAIGFSFKRDLLERAVRDDPDPGEFDAWLLEQSLDAGPDAGAMRAMALEIRLDWTMARAAPRFRDWLDAGAPSDDSRPGPDQGLDPR